MREIKFRGYDNENKCWRFGDYFESTKGIRRTYNIVENRDTRYYCDPDSICQYTGLKDIQGKEIYEGDIISSIDDKRVVVFENGCFLGQDVKKNKVLGLKTYLDCVLKNDKGYSKIGNIYENPKILKSEED